MGQVVETWDLLPKSKVWTPVGAVSVVEGRVVEALIPTASA